MRLKLRVGTLMREKNVTERELSERADVARNTVRSLARGVNTRVDLEILRRVAAALGVRPMELFEEVENGAGPLVLSPAWLQAHRRRQQTRARAIGPDRARQ